MNTLKIYPDKRLQFVEENSIYITENKIQSFNIIFPLTFGDYRTNELECEMRVYLSDDEYMSYLVSTATGKGEVPITNDITEKVQTVRIIFFFTKDGNVIGKTNVVEKKIEDAPYLGDPLTPRAEFDEVISEQRQTIQEQSETITQQDETITQQSEQITELNGEVSELTTENTRLENQHETDLRYIDYLIDNPPEAHLQPKSVTPSAQMQVVEPDEGYQGLSTVTVGAVTPPRLQSKQVSPSESTTYITADNGYEGLSSVTVLGTSLINPELDVFFKREVPIDLTFDQPIVYSSICFGDEMIRIVNFLEKVKTIASTAFGNCKGIVEVNFSIGLETLENSAFVGCSNLVTVDLPEGIKTLGTDSLGNCANLKNVYLPNSLTSIHTYAFRNSLALQNVVLENEFNCSLSLDSSTLYSVETIVSWLEALADRTGQTAYTITMGSTNLNKLTAEQKAIATNKNWNLA